MDSPYGPYIAILLLIVLSAFFSGSEIAYVSANKMRLKKAAETGALSARLAYYIYENYENMLPTVLIGNNLVNMAASSIATVIALSLVGEAGVVAATAMVTVIILIFGEIAPKILAAEHADTVANAVALPLRVLMFLLKPVVFVISWSTNKLAGLWKSDDSQGLSVTEEELVSIIETVEDEGVIDEQRSELLQSAIEFSDISAQEIITPRVDLLAVDAADSIEDILETVEDSPYSRIPVYEGSIDRIIGILYLNHFFKKTVNSTDFSIRDLLMDVCFIPKTMKLPAVLAELKHKKVHMAVVTDEYGGTLGILTMEDVLEQLVGDIWDESDEIFNDFEEVAPNLYLVDGDVSLYDLFDYVGIPEENADDSDYVTVGGWAIEMLHGFPHEGDAFAYENLAVTVLEMEDLRVTKLEVRVGPREEST